MSVEDKKDILETDAFPIMDKVLERIKKRENVTGSLKQEDINTVIYQNKDGSRLMYHKLTQLFNFNKIPVDEMGKRSERRKLYDALQICAFGSKK